MGNRKSTMGFSTSHNKCRGSPLNFPKEVQIPKSGTFCIYFNKKALQVCYKVSSSKNFQRQSCSGINYPSNGINIVAGDDPLPVKFGPKDTNPQFHILPAECCAVDIADFLVVG